MPEGDTIHKVAGYLRPRLCGEALLAVTMADRAAGDRCAGRQVTGVEARGKHLFIELDNAMAIRSHLGLYGSWHRYARGERWKKPRRQASLVLTTTDADYVCFNAREIELMRQGGVRKRVVNGRLGPDLVADDFDARDLVRRAREFVEEEAPVADVLLDQRVACGIGNVYKSEVLYLVRIAPAVRLGEIGDEILARCFLLGADLLRRNLGGGARVTRFAKDEAGRLWVYGRTGQPCHACDTPIASARLGRHRRSSYWCPACQCGG